MPYQPYQSTWNNPYVTSNPYGASPVMPTVQPYQQPVNGIIKVNGRDSAAQYQLPPNSMSPALFDRDGKTFYIVSTDGTGAMVRLPWSRKSRRPRTRSSAEWSRPSTSAAWSVPT